MLPTIGADTNKILRYTAEVGGRILGIVAVDNLVADPDKRAELTKSANTIITTGQGLRTAYLARLQFEDFDHRVSVGKGKGIDRGFDATVSFVSENIRTSLPDRTTQNPDYRAIFPHGAEEYTSPTIRDDAQIANELRAGIVASNLPMKSDFVSTLDTMIPVVTAVANAITTGEQQVNTLFQNEINARRAVVDCLWTQRKIVETILGRAGKTLAKFVFFDFRKTNDDDAASPTPPDPATTPSPQGG